MNSDCSCKDPFDKKMSEESDNQNTAAYIYESEPYTSQSSSGRVSSMSLESGTTPLTMPVVSGCDALEHVNKSIASMGKCQQLDDFVSDERASETELATHNIQNAVFGTDTSCSQDKLDKIAKKQSQECNDQSRVTRPGVYTVSRENFSNVICSDVDRLIAKTRGDASALIPYQVGEQSAIDIEQDVTTNATIEDLSCALPITSGRGNTTSKIGSTMSPGAFLVSHSNTPAPVVSEQVLRLIAKTRGDPAALLPFQVNQNIFVEGDQGLSDNYPGLEDDKTPAVDTLPSSTGITTLVFDSTDDKCCTIDRVSFENSCPSTYQRKQDLEYGDFLSYDDNDRDGLAVANLVIQDDDHDKSTFLPTAVEYDSDMKKLPIKFPRLKLVAFLIGFILSCTIGVALGISLLLKQKNNDDQQEKLLVFRETIGIYENIARLVNTEELNDEKSPFKKALDWITHNDPLLLTPDHPRFMQRYLLSYFYYATAMTGNWTSTCGPDSTDSTIRDECTYSFPCSDTTKKKAFRWLSKQNECEWAGIQCDPLQQVNTIALSTEGMTGSFPEGIMMLPYLHTISLQCGTLSGQIAENRNVEDSTILSNLRLNNNTFTGTVPEQLIKSRSLIDLNLASNHLSGTVSTNILTQFDLKILDLGSNEFSGPLPDEFSQLGNMNYLQIPNNKFMGTIPSTYGQLKQLFTLDISGNFISGTIPKEIGNLKNCEEFVAARNRLIGQIPDNFWNANRFGSIILDDNALTGTISNKVQQLKELVELSISNNLFSGTIPARIGRNGPAGWTGLTRFRATGNHLNGTVPQHLCSLHLTELELDCAASSSSEIAEITCPIDCCTMCCTRDGKNCRNFN